MTVDVVEFPESFEIGITVPVSVLFCRLGALFDMFTSPGSMRVFLGWFSRLKLSAAAAPAAAPAAETWASSDAGNWADVRGGCSRL